MAVLVVGGAGYIGSHTARVLQRKGYDVIVYDNLSTGHRKLAEGCELVVGDIADSAKLASVLSRCDSVMHFAAHAYVGESVSNPRKYFRNNVTSAPTTIVRPSRRGGVAPAPASNVACAVSEDTPR